MRIQARLLAPLVVAIGAAAFLPAACTSSTSDPLGLNNEAGALDVSAGDATEGDGGVSPDGAADPDADAALPPPAAGGTGAFGIVTVGGKQKLYLPLDTIPATNAVVSVVDVGLAGNGTAGAPALIKQIDLGDTDVATASGGDADMVIAVSTINRKIRFIDPKTDTLVKTIELPADFGQSGFSGGGGYVTGVAVDSTHHRAILSVYDGFQIVDLTTMTLGAHIQAPPSENFGFDSVRSRIIAPFYDCGSSTAADGGSLSFCDSYTADGGGAGGTINSSVNVIDLADNNAIYTYINPSATDPTAPLGTELDSASVDPSTGMTVVPSEGENSQNILDLSKAVFDKATKTFTAPVTMIPALGYTGVSVEPTSHGAFFEEEGSADIAVANLTALGKVVTATMPDLPGGGGWANMGDPHGIAVAAGLLDGKPQGFLVSSDRRWVARVSLETLLGSVSAADGGSPPDGGTAPGVTYLDATK